MSHDGEVRGPTGTRFSQIRVVNETGSTNKDLLDAGLAGAPEGQVLVTGHQTAGRGRQGRTWHDDPGSSLLCSVLLRPDPGWASLIPLATGLAVVEGVAVASGVRADLKWPNDVLVTTSGSADQMQGERKLCGILAEAAGTADALIVVVGFGLNLRWRGELPADVSARSIDLASLADRPIDRFDVLAPILIALEQRLAQLETGGSANLLNDYRTRCLSIGRRVRFDTPRGELTGVVTGIDASGGLVLETGDGASHVLTAGEAHHLP